MIKVIFLKNSELDKPFTGIDLFGGQHNHVPTLLTESFSKSIESCYAQRAKRPKFGHMGHQQWIVL